MSLHVLGQLADLPKLLPALLTGVGLVVAVDQSLAVLPGLVPQQPALGGEGLVTSLETRVMRSLTEMRTVLPARHN